MSDNKDKCTIILLQFWGWENISHWNYFLTELPYFLNYLIPNINSACAFHMTVFYAIFWIVQLWRINWSFVISWKHTRKKVLVSPKPLFFPRKILMLQQKYLKTIVKSPGEIWSMLAIAQCLCLSATHSLERRFELGLFNSMMWYEFETCIKLIDRTIKLASLLDIWSMNNI